MTKREAVKKKPLVERVHWLKFSATGYQVTMAGVCLVMHRIGAGRWHVEAMRQAWDFQKVHKVWQAKATAIFLVQKAILAAAQAWSD